MDATSEAVQRGWRSMRTIDADAILKRAEESFKNAGLHGDDYRKFKKWLRTAPTIDAVKVVRCKDCRDSRVYGKTTQWLACESVMEGQATDPNGYCYLGVRKEP